VTVKNWLKITHFIYIQLQQKSPAILPKNIGDCYI
jgi:hypothetical protein